MQIVLPLIAILIIFRAWRGWRRSPLYSPKITLQVVGVCLLIVAVWVALSRGVLSGPLSHSPVALGILAAVSLRVGNPGRRAFSDVIEVDRVFASAALPGGDVDDLFLRCA